MILPKAKIRSFLLVSVHVMPPFSGMVNTLPLSSCLSSDQQARSFFAVFMASAAYPGFEYILLYP